MAYKHRVVQGLADLIAKYGVGGKDPMMRAVWFGIKGQVPMLLEALDNNEEAIATIEEKLKEVLDIKEPEPIPARPEVEGTPEQQMAETEEIGIGKPEPVTIEEVRRVVKKAPPKRAKKVKPVAEAEVVVEPTAEE